MKLLEPECGHKLGNVYIFRDRVVYDLPVSETLLYLCVLETGKGEGEGGGGRGI